MTYVVAHDLQFVALDGRGAEVLPAGEKVESLADYQIMALPKEDREAWTGPDRNRKIPKGPGEEGESSPRWKGAADRCPNAVPFLWRGRLRWADRGNDLMRLGDAPAVSRRRVLTVGE